MELQQYLQILRRYWRSALATLLGCIIVAAGYTLLQRPTYMASSSVFLTVESGGTAGELSQGATYAERTVTSYVKVATTAVVLQPVIDELALDVTPDQLARKLAVASPSATQIITVTASDDSASQAAALSNAVAEKLLIAVAELAPAGPDGARLVSATIIDHAPTPLTPASPRPAVNLALGALLGLMLGAGQAVLRSALDTRVRTADDLADVTDVPVLASIGHVEAAARAAGEKGHSSNAEAYRRLRTNVGFVGLGGERRRSMVITSSVANEGKTETALNLARVLAHAGDSVLLVDADLRRPQLARRIGFDGELGLSDVLSGRGTLQELTLDVARGYLAVLPSGAVPPNPSELLGSRAMAQLIESAERTYDYVLFDTPPLLPVTDAVVLAAQTGGAIVVARSGMVRKPMLDHALDLLDAGDATTLGLVLNDVVHDKSAPYGAYYQSYASTDG